MAADDKSLDLIFRTARTHHGWQDKPVPAELLKQVYELAKWGPTSQNSSPMRIVFVQSPEARERLKLALSKGNIEQSMAAPVTAIIAQDMEFYEKMDRLWPRGNPKKGFIENTSLTESTAFRNSTLQGAYFMLAARALGLDCGPMSGFDNAKLDGIFFAGTKIKSNFLCNLGYGDASKLHPRGPRLSFDEVCKVE